MNSFLTSNSRNAARSSKNVLKSWTRRNSVRPPMRTFIHRTFEDVKKAGNHHIAASGTWESRRYLLRQDGMGFSFHHTILYEGT